VTVEIPDQLPLDDGVLDLRVGAVDRGAGRVALTTRELAMLRYLAARPDEAVPRERLLVDVWEYAPGVESRTVDTTVKRLRKKLEQDPKQPQHLVSVHGVGYRLVPAAAAVVSTPVPDLPEDADAFVGRTAELEALVAAAHGKRQLITLRGPGGVGKSRLARELARLRAAEGDAVIPVNLSSAVSEDDVRAEVNGALGLPASAGNDELLEALSARVPALVLLDQADGCLAALAAIMPGVARGAPSSTAVVTARQLLGLPGELEVRVDPLPVADAVALFNARTGSDADTEHVRRLVEALDGLPLAIELAAGRSAVLTPAEIFDRLDQRFRLLAERRGGRRLDQTIAWSWDALDDEEQRALTACAVFRGGFDLPAAEAVVGALIDDWVLDVVDALEARSLLQRQPRGGSSRFFLLQSVRSFALAQGQADVQEQARAAHRAWALKRAAKLSEAVDGPDAPSAIQALRAEAMNLRAAWDASPPGADKAALAVVLGSLQEHTGSVAVGLEIVEATFADAAELSQELDGRLHLTRARLLRAGNEITEARADAQKAFDTASSLGPAGEELLARSAGLLSDIDAETGFAEPARKRLQETLDRMSVGGTHHQLQLMHKLGVVLFHMGRVPEAEAMANQLFAQARRAGRRIAEGDARRLLGSVNLRRSRMEESWTQATEALALFREAGHSSREALCLELMAVHCAFNKKFKESADWNRQALAIYRRLGRRHELPRALANLARVLLHDGQEQAARRAAEDAAAMAREQGILRQELAAGTLLGTIALSEGRMEDAVASYSRAIEQSEQASLEVGIAAAQACLGIVLLLAGRLDEASEATDLALAAYEAAGDRLGRCHHLATSAAIQAEGDNPGAAQRLLDQARSTTSDPAARPEGWLRICEAFIVAARVRANEEGANWGQLDALIEGAPTDAFARAMLRRLDVLAASR
jgi:predicted ATPase/DNA-binding winged helix-turn-helix (wHTH) protein